MKTHSTFRKLYYMQGYIGIFDLLKYKDDAKNIFALRVDRKAANLQICVKPQSIESLIKFCNGKKGIRKQAGLRRRFAKPVRAIYLCQSSRAVHLGGQSI